MNAAWLRQVQKEAAEPSSEGAAKQPMEMRSPGRRPSKDTGQKAREHDRLWPPVPESPSSLTVPPSEPLCSGEQGSWY